ncbi:Fe3+ hydroxamate ABC transporter substrate-binding protein [Pseudogracilibacillus auburnensis]|uniref:Fe3+ hydroxamate ABC transporter substrate-binding protein n=1 Tax=Pseudogracilibacillus auburnensis TaxID=1494959 RepID=UPI001A959704|nr:Fe3+ hydroxamate ABC transporter substrate-binding protein [Pseudogracilibacillus auburnensis]MBO1001615.1 Fe3+ hydroxamate ABC transporter substrate-binding protein [Pseudogracilibacillus auburnensis]
MFTIKPACAKCAKEIKGNDLVFVRMKYPTTRGMTEIKAYLQNNGDIFCETCYEK